MENDRNDGLTTAQCLKEYLGALTYEEWHGMSREDRRTFAIQAAEVLGVKLKSTGYDHV